MLSRQLRPLCTAFTNTRATALTSKTPHLSRRSIHIQKPGGYKPNPAAKKQIEKVIKSLNADPNVPEAVKYRKSVRYFSHLDECDAAMELVERSRESNRLRDRVLASQKQADGGEPTTAALYEQYLNAHKQVDAAQRILDRAQWKTFKLNLFAPREDIPMNVRWSFAWFGVTVLAARARFILLRMFKVGVWRLSGISLTK